MDTGTGTITDVSGKNPSPLVVLTPTENNLNVYLQCQGITEPNMCSINNIPIQKWVNLLVSVYNRTMDLYLDGKLVRTCLLPGVPQISNTDVQITPAGGFNGWTSKFQYFSNATDPQTAWNIYEKGYGGSWLSGLFSNYQIQLSFFPPLLLSSFLLLSFLSDFLSKKSVTKGWRFYSGKGTVKIHHNPAISPYRPLL